MDQTTSILQRSTSFLTTVSLTLVNQIVPPLYTSVPLPPRVILENTVIMSDRILPIPTVEVPSWSPFDDYSPSIDFHFPLSGISGGYSLAESTLTELCLPLNDISPESDDAGNLTNLPVDKHSSDEFRMYEFKIRRCTRSRSHDWTECPYAHPGEKARRRDPRKHQYSGVACPDFRKGGCKKGDACEFAHGVFECWLHPARYRTQHCKDGTACRRRVCFFAHTPDQIRILPIGLRESYRGIIDSYDGSPQRNPTLDGVFVKGVIPSSPRSTLISPPMSSPANSPPVSPGVRRFEVMASIAKMHLGKVIGFRPVLCSSPAMVSAPPPEGGVCGWVDEEEEVVGRVESGRALRAKMYEKVRKESGLSRPETDPAGGAGPDVGWVSELIK